VLTTYELCGWLLGEVRQALEPRNAHGCLTAVGAARSTLATARELLTSLPQAASQALVQHLQAHLAAWLAPLVWLAQTLAPYRQDLDPAPATPILWAWPQRHVLALTPGAGFPAHLQATVQAFWSAVSFFQRASSLAESLHSWLRPYLQMHRGTPQWRLPLLQLVWNHHRFRRGKRAGYAPRELAGITEAPALAEALNPLAAAPPVAAPQPTQHYTLAAVCGLSLEELAIR